VARGIAECGLGIVDDEIAGHNSFATPFLISPKGERFHRSFPPGGRLGWGFK